MDIARQELAAQLERLYRAAGSPSYQVLEDLGAPARSTISDWITGKSVARDVAQLLKLVRAITEVAPDLPPDLLERRRWRALLSDVRAAETAVRLATTRAPQPNQVNRTVITPLDARPAARPPLSEAVSERPLPSHWQRHATWYLGQIRADVNPRLCVVGAVDAGKTTFFRLLARNQPHEADGFTYAYWRLTEDREGVSDVGFWARVSHLLGLTETLDPRTAVRRLPEALVELHADGPVRKVVLILDEWDDAQTHPDGFVHAISLSRLVQLVHSDQMLHDRPVRLGLCYITRFPSMHFLTRYARRANSRELVRLSGDLPERGFVAARFPFLERESASGLLEDLGCPPETRNQVLEACGGWAGLLAAATEHVREAGLWNAEVERVLQDDLEQMLQKTLLPEVMNQTRLDSPEAAWARILRGLDAGDDPQSRYGLPTAFASTAYAQRTGARGLPGVLRSFLAPPIFLVVDLENLCMRYQKHFDKDPSMYPNGLLDFWRRSLPRAVEYAAEAFAIQPANVVIATKSRERAQEVLGPLPTGWRALAPDIRLARGHQSEADDKVADAFVTQQAAANPASRFVLLTEDQENLGVLKSLDVPSLVIWTPFEAPRGIKVFATDAWTIRENLLPAVGVPRPPVSPSP